MRYTTEQSRALAANKCPLSGHTLVNGEAPGSSLMVTHFVKRCSERACGFTCPMNIYYAAGGKPGL